MRLIDADELIKGRVENDFITIAAKCASTVYDVDKVIEQLNKEYTDAIKMLNDDRGTALEFSAKVRCNSYKRALEIVKAGGVNEKKTEKPDYQNSAGILRSRQRGKETL